MLTLKTLIVAAALIIAASVTGQEMTDPKWYGSCGVLSLVDPMSDEVGAVVVCGDVETEPAFAIAREVGHSVLSMALLTEDTKFVAENTPLQELNEYRPSGIRLRVDRGDIHTTTGRLRNDGAFYIDGETLIKMLMDQVSEGEKFHFSIENFSTYTVILNGVKEAIVDFMERLRAADSR